MSREWCPLCRADLTDWANPIAPEHQEAYGGATHGSRLIGVQWSEIYDGVCAWTCPDCHGWWHRFPEGDRRRERVAKAMEGWEG